MDTRQGTAGVPRLTVVALIALVLLMATTLTAPTRSDAHQKARNTKVFVDSELVNQSRGDHYFTYTKMLSPGCHKIRVVQRGGDSR